jgi:hypothetical protein
MTKIILTALLAFLFQLILPWWGLAVGAFLVATAFQQSGFRSLINGFAGVFLLWAGVAAVISILNEGVLAGRLAVLFSLPSGWLAVLVTGVVGGVAGGLAALTGNRLRGLLARTRPD